MRNPSKWRASEVVREAAQTQRRHPTQAEQALWAMLRGNRCNGANFRRQAPKGPFILDFYCPAAKLSIEVDGSIHDVKTVARRDVERQTIIEETYGIRVLRFTNDEILKTPQLVLDTIQTVLNERRQAE